MDPRPKIYLPKKWPTIGEDVGNPWHLHATHFVNTVRLSHGFWSYDFDLKYLELRLDTRVDRFVLLDRDRNRIHADRVLSAISRWIQWRIDEGQFQVIEEL